MGNRERVKSFLRQVGVALRKGKRIDVAGPLPDGSGELTVRYARFGDMLAVLEHLDTLRAMAEEDAGASRSRRATR